MDPTNVLKAKERERVCKGEATGVASCSFLQLLSVFQFAAFGVWYEWISVRFSRFLLLLMFFVDCARSLVCML